MKQGLYVGHALLVPLIGVARMLAQDELLYQGVGDSSPRVDGKGGEDQSRSSIAIRIVEICEGRCDQIATHA